MAAIPLICSQHQIWIWINSEETKVTSQPLGHTSDQQRICLVSFTFNFQNTHYSGILTECCLLQLYWFEFVLLYLTGCCNILVTFYSKIKLLHFFMMNFPSYGQIESWLFWDSLYCCLLAFRLYLIPRDIHPRIIALASEESETQRHRAALSRHRHCNVGLA